MIEIYGKPNCVQCDEVKTMCDINGTTYKYYILDTDFTRDELFEEFPSARTFPQIKDNGNVIGGISEFKTYFEQTYTGSTEGKL